MNNLKPYHDTQNAIGYKIHTTFRNIGVTIDRFMELNNISLRSDQGPLLMVSAEFQGHSMKDLSLIFHRDKAGVFRGLRSLEKIGMIRLEGDSADKRKRLVFLTPAGETTVRELLRIIADAETKIIEGIPAEELNCFYKVLDFINLNCMKNIEKRTTQLSA